MEAEEHCWASKLAILIILTRFIIQMSIIINILLQILHFLTMGPQLIHVEVATLVR